MRKMRRNLPHKLACDIKLIMNNNIPPQNATARAERFIRENRFPLMLLGMALFLCALPLVSVNLYTGHDIKFHLCRVSCIAENISHGKWFSPVYYSYLNGYGYAAPLFYGDVFLHIPGLFTYLGMEPALALQYFYIIITFCTAFSAYFCGLYVFGDKRASFTSAAVYTFSSYFCVDMLIRAALGELQAFIFLPIIFAGFYSIMFKDSKRWLLLPLGLFGALVSHVLTAVAAVAILFIFSAVFYKKFLENKRRLFYIFLSCAVFFGISAFFILPLAEQLFSHDFPVTNGQADVQWGVLSQRALPLWGVFCDFAMKLRHNVWIPSGVGLSPVLTLAALFHTKRTRKAFNRPALIFILVGFLFLFMTTWLFPWDVFQKPLGSLQFPWRLLIFVTFFFAFSAGFVVKAVKTGSFAPVFMTLVITLSLFSYISSGADSYVNMHNKKSAGEAVKIDFVNTIGAGEYIPTYFNEISGKWTSAAEIKGRALSRGEVVTSNLIDDENITLNRTYSAVYADFIGGKAGAYLDLPLLMYKGYAAEINGERVPVSYGENSLVRVSLGSRESGSVKVWYDGTALQKAAKIVSAITLVLVLAYLYIRSALRRHGLFERKRSQRSSEVGRKSSSEPKE